ncbi:hypothetical protein CHARACLAT_031288 [Characodon lateralis]|uniref:Uncharacterized protein n=1 Tax=Characodon lateralis TaxID=208331 RepID=A0ABU7EYC9_9TELE|nr:hypothetical protein [Characodon lateralis]
MIDMPACDLLTNEVLCAENVTFVSPASVPTPCPVQALSAIKDGLYHAREKCTDESNRVGFFLHILNQIPGFSEIKTSSNYTSVGEGTRKPFADFVMDFETFIQRLKSAAVQEFNKNQQ